MGQSWLHGDTGNAMTCFYCESRPMSAEVHLSVTGVVFFFAFCNLPELGAAGHSSLCVTICEKQTRGMTLKVNLYQVSHISLPLSVLALQHV